MNTVGDTSEQARMGLCVLLLTNPLASRGSQNSELSELGFRERARDMCR